MWQLGLGAQDVLLADTDERKESIWERAGRISGGDQGEHAQHG